MLSNRVLCLFVHLVSALGLITSVHAAATNAVIPYKTMEDACQMAAGVDQTKLMVRVVVESTNQAVMASDIKLAIESKAKGSIPLTLGTNGQVVGFPHSKELVRENPSIVANQPKGTLKLSVSLQFPIPETLTFRAARLQDGCAEVNKMIKAQAGIKSVLAPKAQGVIFIFPEASAGKAKVVVASAAGQKEFVADEKGHAKVKLETVPASGNPEIRLSEKPLAMLPDIE